MGTIDLMHYYIRANYSTIIMIVSMLIFLNTNHFFEKKILNYFKLQVLLLLVIVVADSVEYWTSTLAYPTMLRILMSIIGYSLRPSIIFIMIFIVERGKKIPAFLLTIPLVLNTVIASSSLFCNISFSYSSENKFIRGPLGYTPFVVSIFYIVILIIYTFNTYKNQNNSETFITISLVIISIISTCYESITNYDGIINSTVSISIVFYYLYLTTQQFKRDPLTNVFNRRCFFIDAERNKNVLTAVISIDLNNLKSINDSNGHEYGDRAICQMVDCIQSSLSKGSFLYRVGGDEFMILCFHQKKEISNQIPYKIRKEMENTHYTCAVGIAFLENGIDFKSACDIADLKMYNDKQRQKHNFK